MLGVMEVPLFEESLDLLLSQGYTVVIPMVLGGLCVVVLPIFHFGVLYKHIILPESFTSHLDVYFCSNTCWDAVFKGGYEKLPAGYKHVYFNATTNTTLIWAITICAVILLYESAKYLLRLQIKRRLRYSMLLLFLGSVYSNYYTWWSYFNYLNDDFYSQWLHQFVFSITELFSSVIVLHYSDKTRELSPRLLLMVINIAAFHILAGGWDQFVTNVILEKGDIHQWTRDLGFMVPDLVNIAIPVGFLCKSQNIVASNQSERHFKLMQRKLTLNDIITSVILVVFLFFFSLFC